MVQESAGRENATGGRESRRTLLEGLRNAHRFASASATPSSCTSSAAVACRAGRRPYVRRHRFRRLDPADPHHELSRPRDAHPPCRIPQFSAISSPSDLEWAVRLIFPDSPHYTAGGSPCLTASIRTTPFSSPAHQTARNLTIRPSSRLGANCALVGRPHWRSSRNHLRLARTGTSYAWAGPSLACMAAFVKTRPQTAAGCGRSTA